MSLEKVDKESERTNDKVDVVKETVHSFEKSIDDKLCSFERRVDGQFSGLRERELQEQLNCLKAKLNSCEHSLNVSATAEAVIKALECKEKKSNNS